MLSTKLEPQSIKSWQVLIHKYAEEKGWWPAEQERNIGEILALFHSEISEALEEWRSGRLLEEVRFRPRDGKPEGFWIEIADLIIRVLDFCESQGVDIETFIQMKHSFNLTRPHRHGGKKA